jgi:gluconolactonase
MSNALGHIVGDAAPEALGTGYRTAEGPIWAPDGDYLLLSEVPGNVRHPWNERDGLQVAAAPTNKGNGQTLDAEGRLVVCEHVTGALVRTHADGAGRDRVVLASHWGGKELDSPNDVAISSTRSISFSDPPGGRTRSREPFIG